MKTVESLQKKHAEEMAKLQKEIVIRDALAKFPWFKSETASICIHPDFASVKVWGDFRCDHKLAEAVEIVEQFKDDIIECGHWRGGCLDTWPDAINSNVNKENCVMDGSHAVEISVSGGKEFGPYVCIQFWVIIEGQLCELSVPVGDLWALVPKREGVFRRNGDFAGRIVWNPAETQTADSFTKWWSQAPAYNGSYYFADVANFMAWASHHGNK